MMAPFLAKDTQMYDRVLGQLEKYVNACVQTVLSKVGWLP